MDIHPYAPPAAVVADVPLPAAAARPFFVVAPWKFALLFGMTVGLYQYYWSYMHWARFRRHTGTPMWPVARAVFSIFFAHSLNGEIDHRLRLRPGFRWSPGALATLYVVSTLGAAVADRLSAHEVGAPYTSLAGLVLLLPIGYSMARTQQAANAACDDPGGRANARLGWANWIWIALGAVLWGVILIGFGVILTEDVG